MVDVKLHVFPLRPDSFAHYSLAVVTITPLVAAILGAPLTQTLCAISAGYLLTRAVVVLCPHNIFRDNRRFVVIACLVFAVAGPVIDSFALIIGFCAGSHLAAVSCKWYGYRYYARSHHQTIYYVPI